MILKAENSIMIIYLNSLRFGQISNYDISLSIKEEQVSLSLWVQMCPCVSGRILHCACPKRAACVVLIKIPLRVLQPGLSMRNAITSIGREGRSKGRRGKGRGTGSSQEKQKRREGRGENVERGRRME